MSPRISVVIPVLNAARTLPVCLASVRCDSTVELVLADGGSTDNSTEVAVQNGARLVRGEPGRGGQLIRGASVAGGEWLLFLHADTVLVPEWRDAVSRYIADPANA
jgi:glycosyltransferase involved in cell wall biosynthesis